MTKIHPLVRDLYKRLMFVGRDYPLGPSYVREKVCSDSLIVSYIFAYIFGRSYVISLSFATGQGGIQEKRPFGRYRRRYSSGTCRKMVSNHFWIVILFLIASRMPYPLPYMVCCTFQVGKGIDRSNKAQKVPHSTQNLQ